MRQRVHDDIEGNGRNVEDFSCRSKAVEKETLTNENCASNAAVDELFAEVTRTNAQLLHS
jgi:hypothetical protein